MLHIINGKKLIQIPVDYKLNIRKMENKFLICISLQIFSQVMFYGKQQKRQHNMSRHFSELIRTLIFCIYHPHHVLTAMAFILSCHD